MAKEDFGVGFLQGLYGAGVGNPEVNERRRQSALQEAYMQQKMNAEAADAGMMPAPNVHPSTGKVLDIVRNVLFPGSGGGLPQAFVPDPNAVSAFVGPGGEVSDKPIPGGTRLNPKDTRELFIKKATQPIYSITQLDPDGNIIGRTDLPSGTRSAGIVKPPAKKDKPGTSVEATLNLYETAREGLLSALGKTNRGAFVGRLPSITSNQQNADQAIAAMAPILKQLFRVAGEGVFTDRDQQLLLDMIPTRKTEDVETQIKNIDNIVKAKLGLSSNTLSDGKNEIQDPLGLR